MAQTATIDITLTVAPSPVVLTATGTLPQAEVGEAYSASLPNSISVSGGVAPYTWSATGLAPGLSCSSAGLITGTPTAYGSDTVAVTVTDSTPSGL